MTVLKDVSKESQPSVPLWERQNLRPAIGASEEKKTKTLEARVSPSRYRACQKMVQQRILPEIETLSDIVQAGVGLVIDYAVRHGKDSADFRRAADLQAWESEVDYVLNYTQKMSRILDKTERGLADAKANGEVQRFLRLYSMLDKQKDEIEDEGLTKRAKKIWVLFRDHARAIS